jgi:hypothetical protein
MTKAFLVGTHRFSFRAGEPAEIIGVRFTTPADLEPQACYFVRFGNGNEDLVPIADARNYQIISEADVKAGKIPAVN